MLTFNCFRRGKTTCTRGGPELLDAWEADETAILWLDIEGPLDEKTTGLLRERLALHPLALQDAARDRHPPKIEKFENYTFIIYKGLAAGTTNIDCRMIQIAIFVGERFLVTRHSDISPSIARLQEEIEQDATLFEKGPGALTSRLSRLIVDQYLKILLDLESRLEVLEIGLVGEDAEAILRELVTHRSDLIRLQRVLHYQAEVTGRLDRETLPGFRPDERHSLTDVHEQQSRVRSLCGLYYQLAADLIDGYISVSSHRLNQIMRVLTIITAIFVPLSFLAGVYGMNFENMPELNSRWGYFMLVSIMGGIAATLLWTFRRKRWI